MGAIHAFFSGQWKWRQCVFAVFFMLFAVHALPVVEVLMTGQESFSSSALAAEAETAPVTTLDQLNNTTFDTGVKKKISEVASIILGLFIPLLAFVIKMVGSLMGDAYIYGDGSAGGFNIADLLYQLWDIVRTLVNYAFLLILLFFAFMNVIPYGTDNYELKKVLPKMILAIVVVNLTWFGARVVFDVVDVASRVVFSLPYSIADADGGVLKEGCILSNQPPGEGVTPVAGADPTKNIYNHGSCMPEHIVVNPEGSFSGSTVGSNDYAKDIDTQIKLYTKKKAAAPASSHAAYDKKIEQLGELEKRMKDGTGGIVTYGALTIYWSDFNQERFNESSIASLFAFSVMQIQNLPRIASKNITDLGVHTAGDGLKAKDGNWTTLLINTVAALIIMIIIFLIFVMMMISLFFRVIVLWLNIIASPLMALNMVTSDLGASTPENEYLGASAFLKHAFAPVIMGIPLVIGFIMISVGKSSPLMGMDGSGTIETAGPLIDGVASMHQLFYYVMTIAVLWIGGVKAVEMTTTGFVQSTFIEPISNGVKNVASAIAKAPLYFQFVPVADVDGDGKRDALSFMNMFRDAPQGIRSAINGGGDKVGAALRGSGSNPNQSVSDQFFVAHPNLTKSDIQSKLKGIDNSDINRASGSSETALIDDILRKDGIQNSISSSQIGSIRKLAELVVEAKSGKNAKLGDEKIEADRMEALLRSKITPATPPSTPTAPVASNDASAASGSDNSSQTGVN